MVDKHGENDGDDDGGKQSSSANDVEGQAGIGGGLDGGDFGSHDGECASD